MNYKILDTATALLRTTTRISPLVLMISVLSGQESNEDDIFELSPFTVEASDDNGYQANSSLAGTRLRTSLKDVASTISVVTKEFLEDTNSTDLQELLVYTTGTEVGGIGGNFASPNERRSVGGVLDEQFRRPKTTNRIRGLASADLTRDYFSTVISMDAYNTDRVVINRGANAILFGLGSPAGIINNNTIKPYFHNHGELEFQVGSYGSTRFSLDVEKVLVDEKLSLRIAGLLSDRKFEQDPAFEEDKRIFAVGEFRPSQNTKIRLSVESGEIDANRPRTLPPQDMVSRWFDISPTGKAKPTHDPHNEFQYFLYDENGDRKDTLYFGPPAFVAEAAVVYAGPNQAVAGGALPGGQQGFIPLKNPRFGADRATENPDGSGGITFQAWGTVRGVEQLYANMLGDPRDQNGNLKSLTRSFYVNELVTDRSLFDYRNLLIDGPNKSEMENFDVVNFSLEQVFLNGNAGLAYHYNNENYRSDFSSILGDGSRFQAIGVDVNTTYTNGDPNPNFGRLFVSGGTSTARTNILEEERENHRATGFFRFDLTERADGIIGSLLGEHTVTGLYEESSKFSSSMNLINHYWGEDFHTGGTPPNNNSLSVGTLVYISDDISGQSSSAGANASNLKARLEVQDQYNLTFFDRNTRRHVDSGTFSVESNLPMGASMGENNIESTAIILNSRFFDDHVVATYGYREDDVSVWSAVAPRISAGFRGTGNLNSRDIRPEVYSLPSAPSFQSKSDASNFGVVVHTPISWMNRIGDGMGLSFHLAEAENAQIGTERTNLLGEKLGPVTGTTDERGFTFSFAENRFSVRVNWYETIQNQDDSGLTGAFNGTLGRILVNYAPAERAENIEFNLGGFDDIADLENYPSAFDNAQWVLSTMNAQVTADGESVTTTAPTGLTFPSDLKSEGMEIEGVANLTKNWRLFFNVSKQEVSSTNTAPLFARFIQETVDPLLDRYGKFSTNSNQVESISSWTNRSGLIDAKTAIASDGGIKTNEIREWRWNIGTNYTFSDDSKLKGWNIGGAARWQDKIGIGRPVINDPELGFIPDLDNPIYGPKEMNVDGWIGWKRPLSIGKTDGEWRMQLNVRNLLDDDDLIPVVANPDLTIPVYRIPAERTWELRSTFSF